MENVRYYRMPDGSLAKAWGNTKAPKGGVLEDFRPQNYFKTDAWRKKMAKLNAKPAKPARRVRINPALAKGALMFGLVALMWNASR